MLWYLSPVLKKDMSRFHQLEQSGCLSEYTDVPDDTQKQGFVYLTTFLRQQKASKNSYFLAFEYVNLYFTKELTWTDAKDKALLYLVAHAAAFFAAMTEGYPVDVEDYIPNDSTYEEFTVITKKMFKLLNGQFMLPTVWYFVGNYNLSNSHNNKLWLWLITASFHRDYFRFLPSSLAETVVQLFFGQQVKNKSAASFIVSVLTTILEKYENPQEVIGDYAYKTLTTYPNLTYTDVSPDILERPKHRRFNDLHLPDVQTTGRDIGYGTYASVKKINENQAIKQFACEDEIITADAVVEISILLQLKHSNLLAGHGYKFDNNCVNVVFELMNMSAEDLPRISGHELQRFSTQVLSGLAHLHSYDILHADIKPNNILVRGSDYKLADFGNSVMYFSTAVIPNPNSIYAEKYRPIELLLGEKKYGLSADIFATGLTILAMTTTVFLRYMYGLNDRIKNFLIIQDFDNHEEINILEEYKYYEPEISFADLTGFKDEEFIAFILSLLNYAPSQRPTAETALLDPWLG